MISEYISPAKVFHSLKAGLEDLSNHSRYKAIVSDLEKDGKLDAIGLSHDSDGNLYLGIDLNPELLLYSDTSQETVELRLISEKMKKYTDFLTKEGILDAVNVDYDRVKTDSHYGYVLQIKYNFKKYRRRKFIYDIVYLASITIAIVISVWAVLPF
jgi:hypothetical protein